jgi:serine/threonine protein kinase/tetratricopeptide (TPR) repeat protein
MNAESLFAAAQALPPERRAAFLDTACAGDSTLRERVAAMLDRQELTADSHTAALSTAAYVAPAGTDGSPRAAGAGVVIAGRYALEEKLGAGGMGEVWAARQTEPVKRRVALKLVQAGLDSQAMLARFEQERQALALMDHPHIAKVLDGGLNADGRPFFVMELVDGQPLTGFCDKAQLGIRQRLELFVSICQAVQHAHQKGIIHRDLKPGNILVALADGRPVPKVIDFGVAKATAGKLTDETLATQFGAMLGTLEYMAPEQAGQASADVDTRADIYALGVILYELLTGLRPFDSNRLRQAPLDETVRILREEEPPPPSKRLSAEPTAPALAAARQTVPAALVKRLRGELDWVVMRCLEKDRARRYETADALVREVQRYLADEPVEARPPSAGYRLRKFLTRHKGPVLAAAIVFLALLGGVVGTVWGLILAKQQEGQAARNAAAAIELVHDLSTYVEFYEMGSNKSAATDQERKERLDAALASYERLLELHPEDKSLRWHVARMHRFRANLGRFLDQTGEAERSYRESLRLFRGLVAEFPEELKYRELYALVQRDYAGQLQRLGRYQEASGLLDESIQLYEELLRGHPNESNYLRNLGHMLLSRSDWDYQVGRLAESEQLARRSAELHGKLARVPGDQQPLDPLFHAMAELNLAVALREQDRLKEADNAHRSTVERMMALTRVSNTRDTLSFYYQVRAQRAWTQARITPDSLIGPLADLRGAIQGWDWLIKQLGPNPVDLHRKGVASLYSGRLKVQAGQRTEAVKDLHTGAAILEELSKTHPEIPMYGYELGRTYTTLGQVSDDPHQARDWYRKAREMLDDAARRYPENVHYRKALKELEALATAKP